MPKNTIREKYDKWFIEKYDKYGGTLGFPPWNDEIVDWFMAEFDSLLEEKVAEIEKKRIPYSFENNSIQADYERALVNKTLDDIIQILKQSK